MPKVASDVFPSYPFNKVVETEGGHLFEIDDTPGNERFSRFHKSGTNEEFQFSKEYGSWVVVVKGCSELRTQEMITLFKISIKLSVRSNT